MGPCLRGARHWIFDWAQEERVNVIHSRRYVFPNNNDCLGVGVHLFDWEGTFSDGAILCLCLLSSFFSLAEEYAVSGGKFLLYHDNAYRIFACIYFDPNLVVSFSESILEPELPILFEPCWFYSSKPFLLHHYGYV